MIRRSRSSSYPFVINLKTAKVSGIVLPPNLVALADEVIELACIDFRVSPEPDFRCLNRRGFDLGWLLCPAF
jgi:hypothetical protein